MTWKSRRIRNEQRKILEDSHIKFRPLFYEQDIENMTEFDNMEGDGYCKLCNQDFQNEDLFCSKECKRIFNEQTNRCKICLNTIKQNETIFYHIEHFPKEKIIPIHKKCHLKVNQNGNQSDSRPPQDIVDDYYGKNNFNI